MVIVRLAYARAQRRFAAIHFFDEGIRGLISQLCLALESSGFFRPDNVRMRFECPCNSFVQRVAVTFVARAPSHWYATHNSFRQLSPSRSHSFFFFF